MPSLKREAERRGKAAANTGPSTNNEGRVNSLAEETDEPARGSSLLHIQYFIKTQQLQAFKRIFKLFKFFIPISAE
ncbi:hypothetical protein T4A_298 [Trichinella pseudospiralis]|uniref:Uncharacterized protein n=1 Tax=Trichinella pseudospiralis TaxID=6337 RepID=A0A0V1K2K7_TRIPS|nr:hypothetical protein T4E_5460 [Trichinella pseudospiralis]KRY76270.1 hypothetical protein T4A_298 [Trichinella pseudospiralis]KRZ41473.1 hypothetical protein T4C_12474 [Trichinella pseudospiralis]